MKLTLRELDALVAEHVMGYKWYRFRGPDPDEEYHLPQGVRWLIHPHDDILQAFVSLIPTEEDLGLAVDGLRYVPHYSFNDFLAVVHYLCDGPNAQLFFKLTYAYEEGYGVYAAFDHKGMSDHNPPYQGHDKQGRIGVAICIAALRAVGYTEELEVA